jgi:hypothetical protein
MVRNGAVFTAPRRPIRIGVGCRRAREWILRRQCSPRNVLTHIGTDDVETLLKVIRDLSGECGQQTVWLPSLRLNRSAATYGRDSRPAKASAICRRLRAGPRLSAR